MTAENFQLSERRHNYAFPCYVCSRKKQESPGLFVVALLDSFEAANRVKSMYDRLGLACEIRQGNDKIGHGKDKPNVEIIIGSCRDHSPHLEKQIELTQHEIGRVDPVIILQSLQVSRLYALYYHLVKKHTVRYH